MDRHAGSTGTTLVGRATTLLLAASLAATTLVTVVVAVVTTAAAVVVASSSPVGASTASGAGGGGALILASQTPWVGPGQSLTLHLGTHSSVAVAHQALDVAVYPCLGSVSAFDQALSSPSGTPVAATHRPLPLAPLLQDGIATLSMPVTAPSSTSGSSGSGSGFTITLPDEPGQCGASPSGVYPVHVELVDAQSGTTLGSLTTFLVYDDTAGQAARRLLVAVTLPVQADVAPVRRPSPAALRDDPSSALASPSTARQRNLGATVAQLADHPDVPVTVETSGQTLAGAGGSGATAARLAIATATGNDDLTTTTYAPVDVTALTGAGLTGELVLQLARGAQVASGLTRATAAGGATTWVAHSPPTQGALDALAGAGVRQLVLPASSVAEAPTDGSTARPFSVTGGSAALTAVAANADLSQRMASAASAPALAAQELVAEATQMYFEKPNDTTARGVVASAPAGWTASAPFIAALLQALDGNPLLQPVTAATLAATVPVDDACRSSCRLTNVSPSGGGLPAGAIRVQRARVAELGTATVGAPALAPALGDLVLAGESDLLRPTQQQHVLRNTSDAVSAQLDQVSVSGERTITLTSQQGTLPVTIVSTAPYSIRATVSLASDKLLFYDRRTSSWTLGPVTLDPVTLLGRGHNNVISEPVETRTPGLFTVDITLRAPSGTLEVATGQITVRSSATSIVGIVLSVAALVVLAVWWIRTSRRRRAQRRTDEAGLAP